MGVEYVFTKKTYRIDLKSLKIELSEKIMHNCKKEEKSRKIKKIEKIKKVIFFVFSKFHVLRRAKCECHMILTKKID